VALVLKNLNNTRNWLIVFDNLDEVEMLDEYLPDVAPNKHTLITTRNPHFHQLRAVGLEVSVLGVDDATDLLLTRSNVSPIPKAKTEASLIVRELGCLPLAVEQAAAYIRETLKDIFKYLSSYRRSHKSHHARLSKANRNYYEQSIATTWNLSFNQLSGDASDLLRLLSFLNPDGILTEFLEHGREGLSENLRDVIADPDRFVEALGDLERFSLIRRQSEAESGQLVTIHRLVQSVVKDNMSHEVFTEMMDNAIKLCINGFPDGDFQHHPTLLKCRRFYGQLVIPLSSVKDAQCPTLGCLFHRLGVFLAVDGKFREAVDILKRAKNIMHVVLDKFDHRTLHATTDLAWAYYETGRVGDSVELAEKVLDVRMKKYGIEHEATLTIMEGVAALYCAQGRYQTAAELQADVVHSRQLLGEEHRDTLRAIEGLSLIYVLQGLWAEAAKLQEKVLETRKRILGEESLLTYTAMTNLAGIYQYQTKYELARKLTEPTVEARVRLLGEHPWTFWAKMSLGTVWVDCGKLSDALDILKSSSEGLVITLGSEHPMTLIAMANLGFAYSDVGMFDESLKLLEAAIAASSRISGVEHFNTLWMNECLAEAYYRQGNTDESMRLLATVVETRTSVLGQDHCITLSNVRKLQRWKNGLSNGNSV
jgi:tetratricopeptide (TPR) repeat protein